MFTFYPVRFLNLSFGNSIIYSDQGVQPVYLIPFLFYKSVDHTMNSTYASGMAGQNSQVFFDISSRNLKHLHLFFSMFIDEFSVSRVTDPERHNFISYKGGARLSNWPVKNLSLTGEYTFSLPMTYQHNISTTTFETNLYNLGHYMRDNSRNLYIMMRYKPVRGLDIDIFYDFAQHGDDVKYGEFEPPDEAPVMENITWQKDVYGFNARYQLFNGTWFTAGLAFSNYRGFDAGDLTAQEYLDKFTPPYYQGQNTTLYLGFNIGF
jgi:hypothetical protein